MSFEAQTGAPRILLKNVHKMTYLQSDDKSLWYRDGDVYKQIKQKTVVLNYVTFWNLMTVSHTSVYHHAIQKIVKPAKF